MKQKKTNEQKSSGWGLTVDKSNASKYVILRSTPSPRTLDFYEEEKSSAGYKIITTKNK